MKLSPHFELEEFASPRYLHPTGKARARETDLPPERYHANLRRVCEALEVLRKRLGGQPITIVSGWRSVEFNTRNKGRGEASLHLVGKAADVQVRGASPALVFWTLHDLWRSGAVPTGGLAMYSTFVHYDTRGWPARWRKSPPRPKMR